MGKFVELGYENIDDIVEYIRDNPYYCNDILNIFEENNYRVVDGKLKPNLRGKLHGGTYFGYYIDESLKGLFLFTNKNSLVFYFSDRGVLKKVGVLLEIKKRKPKYIKGVSKQVEDIYDIIHKTVDLEKYSLCYFMSLEKISGHNFDIRDNIKPISEYSEIKNIDFFVEVENKFDRNYYSINDLRKKLIESNDCDYLVYNEGDKIIAQGLIEKRNSYSAQIGGLYVHSSKRGYGIAKEILGRILGIVSKEEITPVLIVRQDNDNAIGLYKGYGFEEKYKYSIYEINY